jgi:hypothetical protein
MASYSQRYGTNLLTLNIVDNIKTNKIMIRLRKRKTIKYTELLVGSENLCPIRRERPS